MGNRSLGVIMKEEVKLVYKAGCDEIVEKKSRFIAHVFPVSNEEEAAAYLEQMKKEYWDARHNCYAYRIGIEQPVLRSSDDGEPSGTAGKPILEVLLGQDIYNVLVVVTRYFGGTLLGTGGLIRAYTDSTKAGLLKSSIVTQRLGQKLQITTNYNDIGKLQYYFSSEAIDVSHTSYEELVTVTLFVPVAKVQSVTKKLTELTAGQAVIKEMGTYYYFASDGSYVTIPVKDKVE